MNLCRRANRLDRTVKALLVTPVQHRQIRSRTAEARKGCPREFGQNSVHSLDSHKFSCRFAQGLELLEKSFASSNRQTILIIESNSRDTFTWWYWLRR